MLDLRSHHNLSLQHCSSNNSKTVSHNSITIMKKHHHKGWVGIESDGTPEPLATILLTKNYIDTVLDPIYK